jgi:hypothetical protein
MARWIRFFDGKFGFRNGVAILHAWVPREWYSLSANIITVMARGWESKSVEAQQDEAAERNRPARARLTREEEDRLRKIESLRLSLENVKQQLERTNQVQRRAVLERAMSDLQERIQELGATASPRQ